MSNYVFRAVFKRIEYQKWAKDNVPSDSKTLHDFEDGEGIVKAIPNDNSSFNDTVTSLTQNNTGRDDSQLQDTLISLTVKDK